MGLSELLCSIVSSFSVTTSILSEGVTHTSGGSVMSFVLLSGVLVMNVQNIYLRYIFLFAISMLILEPRIDFPNCLCFS